MKKSLILFSIVFFTMFATSIIAEATPKLKIKDTELKCDKRYIDNGYTGCTLSVDLKIEDYEYANKYSDLTYKVECEATFDYLTANSYISIPRKNYESDYIRIWGTNTTKTLDLRTSFFTIYTVYKVNVSELSCKVKDIY